MERPPAPEPINIDSVFGPETYEPMSLPSTMLNIRDLLEKQDMVRRALEHRELGKTDQLYDPESGTPIQVMMPRGVKAYVVGDYVFNANIFEPEPPVIPQLRGH